jgi:hypothetical protein
VTKTFAGDPTGGSKKAVIGQASRRVAVLGPNDFVCVVTARSPFEGFERHFECEPVSNHVPCQFTRRRRRGTRDTG